jgi:hypothetical protein
MTQKEGPGVAPDETSAVKKDLFRARVIDDREPFLPLGILLLVGVPRKGDAIGFTLEGKFQVRFVSWVTWYPGREEYDVELAVDLLGEPANTGAQEDSHAVMAKTVEFNARIYEKAASHNNVMLLAGYAGIFAIWGFVKDFLSKNASLWIAILIGSSLLLFVVFELIGMYLRARPAFKFAKISKKSPDEYLAALPEFFNDMNKQSLAAVLVWKVLFYPTVVAGFSAAILLMVNVFRRLADYPSWPS